MGIISWYEGDNDYPAARKAKMKALSVKWLALLNEEHADGNFSGTQKLYETLRMKHKEDGAQAYPSRSFVNDFLQCQFNEQRFKRTKISDTIQAIVSSRPLQMIQVDYLYFYYPSSGIEDARKQGPIEVVDAKTGEEDPGQYYKHILSFTGRSQSSSLVERVNGTIKRLTVKILGSLEKDWRPALAAATEVYNSN